MLLQMRREMDKMERRIEREARMRETDAMERRLEKEAQLKEAQACRGRQRGTGARSQRLERLKLEPLAAVAFAMLVPCRDKADEHGADAPVSLLDQQLVALCLRAGRTERSACHVR